MSKNNVELYSNEEVLTESELQQLQKPKFDRPSFVKPKIEKAVDTKGKAFDITQEMTQEDIDNIPRIQITAKYLKKFYDGLMKSIHKYNEDASTEIINGIIEPLSSAIDNIGRNTSKIDSKLRTLQNELNELREDIPGFLEAPPLPHVTGEENGLF